MIIFVDMNGTTHGPIYVHNERNIDGPMGGSIHVDKKESFLPHQS